MANIITRPQVLSLYRSFLRYSAGFENYNFREYFSSKYKREFRNLRDDKVEVTDELITKYKNDLEILKRQSDISKMYHFDRLVVERIDEKHHK